MSSSWTVYVLRSLTKNRTYVGITTDIERRLAQHNGDRAGGARATRAGRPWTVAARYGPYPTRAAALRVEYAVKKLRGRARLQYTDTTPCEAQTAAPHPSNAVSNAPAGPS